MASASFSSKSSISSCARASPFFTCCLALTKTAFTPISDSHGTDRSLFTSTRPSTVTVCRIFLAEICSVLTSATVNAAATRETTVKKSIINNSHKSPFTHIPFGILFFSILISLHFYLEILRLIFRRDRYSTVYRPYILLRKIMVSFRLQIRRLCIV